MKCTTCDKNLRKVDRRLELTDPDFEHGDITGGQFADYVGATEASFHENWNIAIIEYHCKYCNTYLQLQKEELTSFSSLILGWHEKASENGDYFSRFVFEYLAFIAHIKNNLFYSVESDRSAIQNLKSSDNIRDVYLQEIGNNRELNAAWQRIVVETGKQPLRNASNDPDSPYIDKWWNSAGAQPADNSVAPRGVINSTDDWVNMVEYWYAIRNNLFHGGKEPNIDRDLFLVEHSYITLSTFMELEIKRSNL